MPFIPFCLQKTSTLDLLLPGSISVAAHLLSPSSEDLFHRAIMQSGSVTFGIGSAKAGAEAALKALGERPDNNY